MKLTKPPSTTRAVGVIVAVTAAHLASTALAAEVTYVLSHSTKHDFISPRGGGSQVVLDLSGETPFGGNLSLYCAANVTTQQTYGCASSPTGQYVPIPGCYAGANGVFLTAPAECSANNRLQLFMGSSTREPASVQCAAMTTAVKQTVRKEVSGAGVALAPVPANPDTSAAIKIQPQTNGQAVGEMVFTMVVDAWTMSAAVISFFDAFGSGGCVLSNPDVGNGMRAKSATCDGVPVTVSYPGKGTCEAVVSIPKTCQHLSVVVEAYGNEVVTSYASITPVYSPSSGPAPFPFLAYQAFSSALEQDAQPTDTFKAILASAQGVTSVNASSLPPNLLPRSGRPTTPSLTFATATNASQQAVPLKLSDYDLMAEAPDTLGTTRIDYGLDVANPTAGGSVQGRLVAFSPLTPLPHRTRPAHHSTAVDTGIDGRPIVTFVDGATVAIQCAWIAAVRLAAGWFDTPTAAISVTQIPLASFPGDLTIAVSGSDAGVGVAATAYRDAALTEPIPGALIDNGLSSGMVTIPNFLGDTIYIALAADIGITPDGEAATSTTATVRVMAGGYQIQPTSKQ